MQFSKTVKPGQGDNIIYYYINTVHTGIQTVMGLVLFLCLQTPHHTQDASPPPPPHTHMYLLTSFVAIEM